MNIVPVILCGGMGTRLWPLSREGCPKPFIKIDGLGRGLFEETLLRMRRIFKNAEPIIVCHDSHKYLVRESLRHSGISAKVIVEPQSRGTAPATIVASMLSREDDLLFMTPADNLVMIDEVLKQAVESGVSYAAGGKFVLFGEVPTRAETGYGYIIPRRDRAEKDDKIKSVKKFIEKPSAAKVEALLETDALWNCGMVLFKASALIEEAGAIAQYTHDCCKDAVKAAQEEDGFIFMPEYVYADIMPDSLDYAILEPTNRAVVCPVQMGWNDLGSFTSMYENVYKDENDNAVLSDFVQKGVKNSLVYSENRLIAAIDVENLAIIDTQDAILIAPLSSTQKIRELYPSIKRNYPEKVAVAPVVRRPWGSYEIIARGNGYQVKRIVVNPYASLSLQSHQHRREHWLTVSGNGTALIEDDDQQMKETLLYKGVSVEIDHGMKHRLSNSSHSYLVIIETQYGEILDENDIIRYNDDYGRKN